MLIAFIIVCSAICLLWFWPIETDDLRLRPSLNNYTYAMSVEAVENRNANLPDDIAEYGKDILLTHDEKVSKVIVFFHGYTNAPRQYEKLSKLFFDRGYNVYVPRVVYHGSQNRYCRKISALTAKDLALQCQSALDIASGLGNDISVFGLSMGGVMAAWCAQNYDQGLDDAFVLVPSFGWFFLPGIIRPLINFTAMFPNMFVWWDPVKREKRNAPFSMYHHFASRPMGEILRLGLSVIESAKSLSPHVKRMFVIRNALDIAVDNPNIDRLVKTWESRGVCIKEHTFPKSMGMEHDIIDPLHPYERTDEVYAKIFELMNAF